MMKNETFHVTFFFLPSLVSNIASRACISVPASIVTRRAELSSKGNTAAGALFTEDSWAFRCYLACEIAS